VTELVIVQRTQGLLKAQVIKARLESHGVPVALDYESAGPAIGITLDGLGEVRILVPARLERRARRLLSPPHRSPSARRRWRRAVRASRWPPGRTRGRKRSTTEGRSR